MDSKDDGPLVRVDRDVPAALDGLATVHQLMADYWRTVDSKGCCCADGMWRALFDSAIAEIAGNIVRHAYPEPVPGDTFHISLQCFPDRMEAVLLDHGLPFDFEPPSRTPDMRDALDDLDLDHGWGLPIVYAATDALDYERLPDGQNRWHLGKRLP